MTTAADFRRMPKPAAPSVDTFARAVPPPGALPATAYPFAAPFADPQGSPIRELFKHVGKPGMISFAGGYPSADLFDREGMAAALADACRDDPVACLQYGDTAGQPGLRRALAHWMASARGVHCDASRILVTTGSQQGFDLLVRTLIEPGDAALVEAPAYPAALQALRLAGARLVAVRTDGGGVDPDALAAQLAAWPAAERRPKLLYTVPTFANPTGATLPPARRAALAALAARERIVLVEDDPYADLRFTGEPVAPILGCDGAQDWTVYLGSLSKIVAPGLRIGWAVAPEAIARRMTVAKQTSDLCTAPLAQEAIRRYLDSGRLAVHLRTIARTYGDRCRALISALRQFVPDDVEWREPAGGMFVWARLTRGRDATALLKHALEHNVMYVPGAAFYASAADTASLRLSFAAPDEAEIFEGVRRLRAALAAGR
ncbi:Sulfite reductase [NADPH] flavoprotein alpha-component [Burkholderia singularis]|uniref:Sulfite reductase [NADPH] flavoprotein alpha-component n=2 Tax=Burkholderia singularis TaxID=1503053 RepID=A0A238H137_9BURK|nr:PLP-dependent aminotransferase family protein [Burkholderia singularis]SMF98916.1 Sulfite reductase [NADPH] flavoprotein alpha-component [Burkholderia singularis]